MLGKLHHYAHALEVRLFQLSELSSLRGLGKGFAVKIWKLPGNTEDWVNLARFIDAREKVMLLDIGANVGGFTSDFLSIYQHSRSVCIEPVSSTVA